METWETFALIGAAVAIVGIVVWFVYDRERSRRLQARFGPEYDRFVAASGNRRRAESELARREMQAKKLVNQPLNRSDREKFLEEWNSTQARFVDDPAGALNDADELLIDIMRARGFSADNTYDRTTDIAAAYPQHVTPYREAGEVLARHRRGEATTDELRIAFLHYRTLFDDLLGAYDEKSTRAA